MRRALILALVVAVAAFAFVQMKNKDDDDGADTSIVASLKEGDLKAALITAEDFPEVGYAELPTSETDAGLAELFPEDKCDDALEAVEPDIAVSTGFRSPNGTVTIVQSVERVPGGGAALPGIFDTFKFECRLVRMPDGQVTIGPLRFGALTDNTQSAQVLIDRGGAIRETDIVVAYQGDLVSTIVMSGERPTDKGVLDEIVREAVGKLAREAQGL